MKLNVPERISTLNVISRYNEGNYIMFKVLNQLKEKLGFNEEELKLFDVKEQNNLYHWNDKGQNEPVEIEITEKETSLIVDKLKELDSNNKLTIHEVPVYEKFIDVDTKQ